MNDDNRRKLYDALSADYDMGTFEQFSADITDKGKRKKLYDAIKNDYDLPDFEGFSNQLGIQTGEPSIDSSSAVVKTKPLPTKVVNRERMTPLSAMPKLEKKAATAGQPVKRETTADKTTSTGAKTPVTRPTIGGIPAAKMPEGAMRFNSADLNNWKQRSLSSAKTVNRERMTPISEMPNPEVQRVNDVVGALRGDEKAAKRAGLDKAMRQVQDRIDYANATGGKELTGPIEDSEILAPTVGRDAEGRVITDADGKPMTGVTNDQGRVNAQKYEREKYKQAEYNSLSAQMERAQQELEGLDKQLETPQTELGSMFSAPLLRDEKRVTLERARKQVEERIKGLQVEMAGGEQGFWKGLTDAALDKSTWMFGLDKLADSARALRIANKMRNGEQITDEERTLLEATMANQEVQQRLDDNSNFMYRAGRMTTEMVPFMIGIGVTGGMSGVSGIGVNAGRRAMAAYARKYGTDALRHRVAEGMLQGTGALVGDLMAGVAMANTVGAANTLSDILDRRIGRLEYDPEGNPVFVGGKSWGESIYQGEVGQSLEYATEMMGAHILEPRLSRLVKFAGETGGMRGAARVVKGIAGNDTYKATTNWLKRMGIQDIPSEGLEEEVNMLLGIGLHADDTDEQVRQFLDSDTHKEIWGGMGLSIAFMHGFGAGTQSIGRAYNEVQYARYKTKVDDASKVAGFRLGEDRWDAWKKKIDNTQNEDMGNIYTQVLDETSMAPEEKQAVVDYMQKLTSMRGYNLGRFRATQENASAVMPDEMAAHDTYNEGVLARGGERNAVGRQAREAASALNALPDGEGIGQEIDRLVNEDESYMVVEGYLNNLSEESREAARAYYLSAIRSKGVWDNAQEEVDNRVKDFEQSLAPGVVENEDGRSVMLANVQGAPALVVSDNGDTAVIYQNGRKRQVKSGDVQDVEIYNYDEYVNSYRQQEEQKATAEVEFALNNHANTQMPSVGLTLHEGEDTYQVTGINPSTGEVTATKVKLDKDGQLVPDGGAMVTLTEQEVLDLQNQYYEDLDARKTGLAAQPQQTEQPEAEQGTEEEPAIEEVPAADEPGTVTLEEQRNAVLAIDPEAQDLLDTIEWQINDYGVVAEGFWDSVPRELEEPLREYARMYAEAPVVEEAPEGEATVPAVEVPSSGNTSDAQPTETELPRDKDGDLDIDAIRQSGDGQVMADALKAKFGNETANAVAQEYLTEAVKAQEREKNPAKKMGSKKKAVDFWREVAEKLNVSAEGGSTAKAADTERADTNGMLKAGAAATEKWAQAEKIVGAEGIYTMDDGSDISGRYVLVEEGSTTPSHDPHTFESSEGYPVNEQGQNANSRDYQNSPNAQASVAQMGNDYDGRALKDVPVVSADGIVWSGNNRTMSGMLAAENGKDGKYIESLKRQAARFGFAPEQIEGMQHPRVVFVPDEGQGLDYTPQTFNRFNAPSQKEEGSVEKGVKMGKVLSDHTFNLLQQEVARFGGLSSVFKSPNACREILRIMQEAAEIVEVNQQTLPRYITPDGLLTEEGQNLLESALVGYVFKNNPEVVSQIDKLPKRALNQLAEAMPEITANASAGEYALMGELAEAIRTLVEQQASGQSLDEYMKQMDLFRENTLVAKTTEALVRALDARTGTPLKDILAQYNDRAVEAASGQEDIFSDNSREGILRDVLGIGENVATQSQQTGPNTVGAENAFEKKNSVFDNMTGTGETAISGRPNDTTTPQDTASKGKDTESDTERENGEKNVAPEKRDSYNAGERVILDEDGKEYTIEYITTEGDFVPGQPNTYTTYYHLEGKLLGKYTADQLSAVAPTAEAARVATLSQQAEQAEAEYGKGNKLVSRDRYEELKKRMQAKLRGQANAGFDPEILAIGTEMAMFHVEAGARTFIDFAKRMINDLGDAIRPYLKAIYNGAKDMPGMEELRKTMTSYEGVMNTDVNGIAAEGETEIATQSQQAEPAEQVEPAEQIEETVVRKEEDADKYRAFSQSVTDDMLRAMKTGEKPYKSIVDIRAKAKALGLDIDEGGRDDILLQELVEDGLVSAARQYVSQYIIKAALRGENTDDVRRSKELFDEIVRLYSLQPTISQRSTNRIRMQQYSTPLPMSFAADMFVFRERMRDVLEPTAGNGMLVFAIPEGTVHANELDKTRLDNLRAQKFKRVTDQDAMQPFEGDQQYDAVITNPPFGNAEAKEYDGKMIPGLAPQIALNALSKMKDNGKAAIIIGGNMTYGKNGGLVGDKQFFTYLYDHYNVKGVIDMDGKLNQKQGTTYPTRMILIDGRRSEADRELSKVYPPRESEALPKAETFDDLYRIVTEVINSNKKTNGNEVLRAAGGPERIDGKPKSRQTDLFDNPGQSDANDTNGRDRGTRTPVRGRSNSGNRGNGQDAVSSTSEQGGASLPELGVPEVPGGTGNQGRGGTSSDNGIVPAGRQSESNGETGRGVANGGTGRVQLDRAGGTVAVGQSAPRVEQKPKEQRKLNQEKLSYRTHNTAFSLESVGPAAMVESMDASLSEIEKEVGSIDEFVRSELGYDTIEEAHNALAAEQMDSVAMAIYQMKKGNAMIIGDQTGVGKGRQMAALIRWAVKQGKKPVFITKDANLFSDIYRDLVDIGSGDLRPFIFNSATGDNPGVMTDKDGNVVYRALDKAAQNKVLAGDKLPDDYDYAVLSYSQVNTGDAKSREEARQIAEMNGGRAKKKDTGKERPTPKADFLRKIAKDNIMLLDESHSAAGESNTGAYLQSLVKDAKAVTFASATFAKRPDTMPLYAIRTAMSKANVKPDELIAIIEKGGVTLQEIMSRALSESGQMVRRERDMSDVKTDWTTVDDEATVKRARENYDRTIEAFNAIIQFQKQFVEPKIAELDAELGWMASSADVKKGTKNAGVDNPPFVNKTFNYTKQLLLALKVDAIVDQVEAEIKAGRHPVIALESTMESSLSDFAVGEAIEEPTFALSLLRGLDTVMQYTVKDEDGKETHATYSPAELGPVGEKAYYALQDFIRKATQDVFISPLDAIIEKLNERGYKVGELTGRKTYLGKDGEGNTVVKSRGKVDKKKLARDFNSGELDVLILNKSASTGISLHASEKFADQRQRTMIIAQPLSDINDYMQMIGRIDRTGQVHRGYYINLGLPVPAESRFLMMLATKLKSLNANTTTSQESKSSDVEAPDLLNKYGSQVIIEYLRDNPEVYEKMGQPLGKQSEPVKASELEEYRAKEDDASRITGRVALLSTAEQDAFYDDVVKRYNDLIKYLDETGTNDLKITVLPLRAKTARKKVSSEGADPKGRNPFAQNAYVEEVEMDVLRKPMKAEEVRKAMTQLNKPLGVEKGHMRNAYQDELAGERVLEIVGTIEREREAKLQAEDERYDRDKSKAEDSIRKRTEKINASTKASEAEKREVIETYAEEQRAKVDEAHEGRVNAIKNQAQNLTNRLGWFAPGQTYLVPDNLDTDVYMFTSPAIFCGYKAKESKVTPSTTFAVFATLDGRRRIEVKMSQIGPLTHIKGATDNNFDTARRTNLDNWDSQLPTNTRKKGYIMTGNILQAVADTQDQNGNYPGQLISFTDENGEIRDGILMPDKWEPGQLKTAGAPILSRIEQIKKLRVYDGPVVSTDGKVQIKADYGGSYHLRVPKSKKEGGQYFLNDDLLALVELGEFYQRAGMMQADVEGDRIEDVVKLLSQMGVRVSSEDEMGEDESTDEKGEEGGVHFHIVSDPFKIAELEMGPKIRVYREMQLIDGKLYPPMSAKTDGKLRKPIELGMWEEAEERPEMVDSKGFFILNKGNGKSLKARYNPYFHTSRSPLNDQFTSAYDRPNLVTTEVEVPESELTSGYKAEKAKDAVGEMTWHAGPVSGKLPEGKKRKVILSRWDKPIRIVPDSEVASKIAELLEGENIPIPYNTISPSLRAELEKRGVKVSGEAKGNVRQDGGVKFNVVEPIPPFDMSKLDTRDVASLMSAINERNNTERAKTRIAPLVEEVASEMEGAYGVIISTGPSFLRDLAEDERLTKKERQDLLGIASGALAPNAGYIESIDKIIIFNLDANKKEIKSYLCHETTHRAIRNMGLKGSVASWYEALEKLAPQRFAEIRANYAGINRNEQTQKEECVVDFVERTVSELGIEGARAYFSGLSQRDFNAYGLTHIVDYIKQGENDRRRIPAKESRDRVGQEEVRRGHADATGNGAGIDGNRSDGTNLHVEARPGLSDEERGRGDRERGYTPVTSRKENGRSPEDSQRDGRDNVRSGRPRGGAVRSVSEKGREGVSFSISSVRHNAGLAQAEYDATVSGFAHRMRETWQDSMLSLKRLQDAVLKETGGRLLDSQNAWMAENRLSSSNAAQQEEFRNTLMAALVDAVAALGGADERQYERIKKYMIAKHGLERNIVFAERDAREAAGADSGPEYDSFLEKFRKRDYSGLTGLFGVDDVEDAEDMARDYVDRFEDGQDEEIADLWDAVRGVSGFALQKSLDSGMISQETFDTLRAQFENYIPLRGWDETTSDEVYDYIGRQVAGVQDIMKHAKGRKSVADDPLATLQNLAESAIIIGNRNMVKQHFLNLATMHKTSLVSVSPIWLRYNDITDEWEAAFPAIDANDSAEEVARKTEAFNQQMESLAQFDPDHYKRSREKAEIPFIVRPGSLSSHQVLVKQGGRTYVLTVNGNPRAAEAVNGLTNPDAEGNAVMKAVSAGSRWIASWSTAKNVGFIASNLVRDGLYTGPMAFIKEGGAYGARYTANWWACARQLPRLLRMLSKDPEALKRAAQNNPNSLEGMFYDFVHNGGETGYTIVSDVEDCKKYIEKELRGGTIRKPWDFLNEILQFLGRWSEGVGRFAAYRTSREMGRSKARAIYDAKDISVNFSKKGAGKSTSGSWEGASARDKFLYTMGSMSQMSRAFYSFFNASVQGLENIGRASWHNKEKAMGLFGGLMAMGAGQAYINELLKAIIGGDDDDDYYNLPEWQRSSNIILYLGKYWPGGWLKLPLPIEFGVPFGLGGLFAEYANDSELMSGRRFGLRFAQQLGKAMPLDPTSEDTYFNTTILWPTALKPIAEVGENRSWTGLPIANQTEWNKRKPEYQRVYSNAGKGYVGVSRALSELTGGTPGRRGGVEINPQKMQYLIKQYLSGGYNWFERPVKIGQDLTGEKDFEWQDVPVLYRFTTKTDQKAVEKRINSQFFDLKDEMDGNKYERDTYVRAARASQNDALEYAKAKEALERYENSRAYTEYMIWHMGDKQLQKIREQGKEGEDVEENEYMLKQQMIDAIRTYRKTRDENKAIDVYPQGTATKATDAEAEEEATT